MLGKVGKLQIKTGQGVTNPYLADGGVDLLTIWEINNLSIWILNFMEMHYWMNIYFRFRI